MKPQQPNSDAPQLILSTKSNSNPPEVQDTSSSIDYRELYEQEKKKVAILEHQLELEKIKTRKLVSNNKKAKLCAKCLMEGKEQSAAKKQDMQNVKEDLKGFSDKIGQLLKKNQDKSLNTSQSAPKKKDPDQSSPSILTSVNLLSSSSTKTTPSVLKNPLTNPFPIFQNFTIFGVSEQSIAAYSKQEHINKNNSVMSQPLEGELLYSFNQPSDVDKQAGKIVFPNGVGLKRMIGQRARDKGIQIMSYSYANLKSFILRFLRKESLDQQQYEKNQFLCHINPSKNLFCLCIGISDYTTIQKCQQSQKSLNQLKSSVSLQMDTQFPSTKEENQKISTTSMGEEIINTNTNTSNNGIDHGHHMSNSSIQSGELDRERDKLEVYLSQRVFCISSYYPFFSFYEEILRSLLNFVKMERLMIFKHANENLSEADSRFHLQRMKSLFLTSIQKLNSKRIGFNRSYQLAMLNHQKITLLTDWTLAKNYFMQEWIFPILNMFNVDTFVDLFTLMMLEDKLVFICNNSHVLTYTIFLFTHVLVKPLIYPWEVLSIIPEDDFLGAPFPVVCGMLRKRKDVQNSRIMMDYKNTYVFLSPDKVDIVCVQPRKHILKYRPQKLKSDLAQQFKDLKKPRSTVQKPAKYQIQSIQYPQTSTIEQREISVSIIQKLNEYMLQEVVNRIPNQYQIRNLKNSIDLANLPQDRDQHTILLDKIKEVVKKGVKEIFLDRLLDTQIISNLVCK